MRFVFGAMLFLLFIGTALAQSIIPTPVGTTPLNYSSAHYPTYTQAIAACAVCTKTIINQTAGYGAVAGVAADMNSYYPYKSGTVLYVYNVSITAANPSLAINAGGISDVSPGIRTILPSIMPGGYYWVNGSLLTSTLNKLPLNYSIRFSNGTTAFSVANDSNATLNRKFNYRVPAGISTILTLETPGNGNYLPLDPTLLFTTCAGGSYTVIPVTNTIYQNACNQTVIYAQTAYPLTAYVGNTANTLVQAINYQTNPLYAGQFIGPSSSKVSVFNFNSPSQITVSAWVTVNNFLGQAVVTMQPNDGNFFQDNWQLTIDSAGGGTTPRWLVFTGGSFYFAYGTYVANFNQWYNLIGTYDGTTVRLYVNGVAQTPSVASLPINTNVNTLLIGLLGDGGGGITGSISNVQVYNTAITANAAAGLYYEGITGAPVVPSANVLGWWTLNQNTYDYSGNGKQGVSTGVSYAPTNTQMETQTLVVPTANYYKYNFTVATFTAQVTPNAIGSGNTFLNTYSPSTTIDTMQILFLVMVILALSFSAYSLYLLVDKEKRETIIPLYALVAAIASWSVSIPALLASTTTTITTQIPGYSLSSTSFTPNILAAVNTISTSTTLSNPGFFLVYTGFASMMAVIFGLLLLLYVLDKKNFGMEIFQFKWRK